MDRLGAIGVIEDGPLKGRKFIIPASVFVEKGAHANGAPQYQLACIKHHKFLPDQGCKECDAEVEGKQKANAEIGLV